MVGDDYNFKIVDIDREKCIELAQKCPSAQIIHADARDTDALSEA